MSLERVKKILNNDHITTEQVIQIRDFMILLARIELNRII